MRKEDLELTEEQKAEFGWEEMPAVYFPVEIGYATVHKEREKGPGRARWRSGSAWGPRSRWTRRWPRVRRRRRSTPATWSGLHGTQRHFNARKARKVYTFSKELVFHVAVTWLCVVFYNFGWTPRTLREKVQENPPRYHYRTPAMVAGLTDHCWSLENLLTYPLFPTEPQPTSPHQRHTRSEKSDGG